MEYQMRLVGVLGYAEDDAELLTCAPTETTVTVAADN